MFRTGKFSTARQRLLRTLFVLLPATFFLPLFSPAQSLNFRQYSVDEGLPFVQVYTIFQDNKGNLWTGGYGGLSRFDGLSFTNFSPRNGLPNHWVTSISEDASGDLWVGTIEGAARYHEGKFETFTKKNGLPDDYVNCLLKDDRNGLWFGTVRGLARYDGTKFSGFGKDGPGETSILCFYQEPNTSHIWIGTANGIYLYDNGTFTHFPLSVLLDNRITAITQDATGKILAGTGDGLFRLENGHFNLLITPEGFEMPAVSAMVTDRDGMVWIGAENGLFSYDARLPIAGEKNFRHYRVSRNNRAGDIISLFIDYESSLWLGTHSGLYRFRGEGFTSYSVDDGLIGNFIFGITEDSKGTTWVCSETHGVYAFDGRTFTGYDKKEGLASSKTNACQVMAGDEIFVGTDRGLSVISPNGKIRNYHREDGLNSDSVNVMLIDRKGRLLMGCGRGLTICEDGKFTPYTIPSAPDANFDVWTLFEDSRGTIWLGTYLGGLYTFDGKKFTEVRSAMKLGPDSYFGICEDNAGNMYFGTLDGLFITTNGVLSDSVTQLDGLSSDLIYCMILDKEKKFLWIGTNQGLTRFDVQTYSRNHTKLLYAFGKEEGFAGVESNSNGAFISRDGSMWFGTVNGLVRYSPEDFRRNTAFTKTSITGTRLFYADTSLSPNPELGYYDNNISFDYVGICLTNPAKVKYRVMLVGFDSDWSPVTSDRVARYSNLPPGTYTFRVISCNNEGLWNNDPAEFTFTILTPIWKRPWFWLLLTATSVLALALSVIFRIRQVKRRERVESETQIAMARNELKALRAQMNPHFVFNSLNSIQHFILTNKSADAGKYLNKFARLMRVILNNSEKSLITVREEMEYLQLYLELEEMRFENKFSWSVAIDDDVDIDYFEIPAMLLQPYVENAILHGLTPKKEKGRLEVLLHLQKNTMVCSIIDDGIGRDRARELRQLSSRKDHKSLGMKITHDRLELINRLHGSQLSLTITDLRHADGSAAGTRVDIFIPVS